MRNRILLITIGFILNVFSLFAQDIPPVQSNYYHQELFVNPAFTGSQNMFSGTLAINQQWVGYDKAPQIQRLQAHSSFFNDKVGLGLSMQNQKYGVTHNFNLSTYYAYKLRLGNGSLSLGLKLGFATSKVNFADLNTSQNDLMFSQNTKLMWGMSCGVGAYYFSDNYYVGISLPQIIDNSLEEGKDYKLNNKLDFEKMPFYLTTGYVFDINPSFQLKPAVLLNYSSNYNFGYNFSLSAFFKNMFWVGALARYDHEAGGFLGVNILNYFNLNYCFAFSYGDLNSKKGASHEVSLNVTLNFFDSKKPDFKYF